ncbi:Transcription regulator LuxR, C-terminal [Candidatus Nanopelagicaceae bacterium]
MAVKKGEKTSEFEVTSGVTLSRTLIPTLPPNYLSRKHLFPLLENPSPSTTVLIAPAGYGKTSLVAEWALANRDRVIWLTITESDSIADMSALFVQATRNIIPNFAPWFEAEPGVRPVEIVRRWGNELLAIGKEFIFIIDNLREHTSRDVDIAVRLVEQFPPNIQFVTIRRDSIETVYATFSSRGPLSVIGPSDLAFSESEISALATMHKINYDDCEIRKSLEAAHGWPAAVTMLMHQVAKNKKPVDFEKLVSSQVEPLRALATSVIESLDEETRSLITSLSVVQEFTHEIAEVILGDLYSYDVINQIALDGNFFSQTGSPEQTFEFSLLMREVLLTHLRKDKYKKMRIHAELLAFHENRNEPNLALEHAYLAGDFEKLGEIFPDAARIMQASGRGNELIRWSIFAGDNSEIGLLKRATVELTGRLALQDYDSVMSMIAQMNFDAKDTVLEGFIRQITYGAKAYVDIALGRFDEFDISFEIAMSSENGPLNLGIEEQIGLLRLAAMKNFILDETEKVEAFYEEAKSLANKSKISNNHLLLSSMNAMVLFQIGDYRRAYEAASIAYSQFNKLGYVGNFGPLDSMFIIARCQLEFARPREAFELFAQIRNLGEQWKQWAWHFFADGYFARDLIIRGMVTEALDNIKRARERANEIEYSQALISIIDLSELFIRFTVKDNERLGALLERAPKLRFVQQIQLAYDERMGKKSVREDVKNLPIRTPREKIWKHLADAHEVIGQENQALKEMKKALEIGATVGAKETFLRQSPEMGNLIMKIAGQNPTVYLEDLASSVADRIKSEASRPTEFASSLTKRELEVLRHLSTDRPISAIAASLHISLNTMKTHLKNLYRKMEVDGRVSAVEKAKAHFIL